MSLDNYREQVARLARRRDGEPIFNGSIDHAAVIVENMFKAADSHVEILSGELNPRVYGLPEVIREASLFLVDADHKLRILVEEDQEADRIDHPFFEAFKDRDNVEFKRVLPESQEIYDFHFLVMDGDSYRFEEDKTKPAAIAAFGDVEGAENLGKIFEDIWSNFSTDLQSH